MQKFDYGEELYLTPFVRAKEIEIGRRKAKVSFPEESECAVSDLESYSGFLTVDEKTNSNLYFWFFPAEISAEAVPIMLWLQGGPGSSSLIGLFNEHGPYFVDDKGNLHLRHKNKWTSNHSIIYMDNPVGAGFSFTDSRLGYAKSQEDVSRNLYEALQQFFLLFPEFRTNDFYLGGQSYAGKYIPWLGYKIHYENQLIQTNPMGHKNLLQINLKGILIGSAFTDPLVQLNWGEHLYNFGLVDEFGKGLIDAELERMRSFIKNKNWLAAFEVMQKTLLDFPPGIQTHYEVLTGIPNTCNLLDSTYPHHFFNYRQFLEKSSTRRQLHIGKRCLTTFGQTKAAVFSSLAEDFPKSAKPQLEALLENNYKALLFSCQLDIVVPFTAVENLIRELNWSGSVEFEKKRRGIWEIPKTFPGQPNPAGYGKEVRNLAYVFLRNAGHMAMADQGEACFDMVTRFTRNDLRFSQKDE